MKYVLNLLIFSFFTLFYNDLNAATEPVDTDEKTEDSSQDSSDLEDAEQDFIDGISKFPKKTTQLKPGNGPVTSISIDGSINPLTADFLKKSLDKAIEKDSVIFVLKLNTPGGLLTSMQSMVESILDSPVPVVVYVAPSGGGAISAGVFITMAGHVAVMSPGTTIGAAHPVQGGGGEMPEDVRTKVENFSASMVKAIAEQRGRNVEWAEKAVRESVALTDNEALKENVIDFISPSLDSMLSSLEGMECQMKEGVITLPDLSKHAIEEIEMSLQERIINAISDPNVAALLGLAAVGGILAEFYNPGLIIPGLIGVVCLILSLVAVQIIPINAGGILLLLLAVVLMSAEFFMPSFGIFGIAGLVCLVLGSIYVVDTSMVWSVDGFQIDVALVGSFASLIGILLLLLIYFVISSKSRKYATGVQTLTGKIAKVTREFQTSIGGGHPNGSVKVNGEIWSAELLEGDLPVPKESEVEIVAVDGLRLKVKKI